MSVSDFEEIDQMIKDILNFDLPDLPLDDEPFQELDDIMNGDTFNDLLKDLDSLEL